MRSEQGCEVDEPYEGVYPLGMIGRVKNRRWISCVTGARRREA